VRKIRLMLVLLMSILPLISVSADDSVCYGTTAKGKLRNGVELPRSGVNFQSYSSMAGPLGRTYVHSKVKKVLLETYAVLEKKHPGKKYKYAETGFKEGGKFKPHKTHQNGLSVDFIVPVMNRKGKSVYLPTTVFNKWGYAVEFDNKGHFEQYRIDFESLAAHLVTLHKTARKNGINIQRVIFDPKLQPFLLKTRYSKYIKRHITLSNKNSWVRHDDHYHVDFKIKCRSLRRFKKDNAAATK